MSESFQMLYDAPVLPCFMVLSTSTPAVAQRPPMSSLTSGMRANRRSANLSSSTADATSRFLMRRPENFSVVSTRCCCLRSSSRAFVSRARSLATVLNAWLIARGDDAPRPPDARVGVASVALVCC